MAKRHPPTVSLNNYRMSDRELLYALDDCTDGDGLVLVPDVIERLGLGPDDPHARRAVSSRLGAMKRFGFVARVDPRSLGLRAKDGSRYVITQDGQALMRGRITKAVAAALDRDDPGTQLLIMRELSIRAFVHAGPSTAAAVRREWLHNAARRPR